MQIGGPLGYKPPSGGNNNASNYKKVDLHCNHLTCAEICMFCGYNHLHSTAFKWMLHDLSQGTTSAQGQCEDGKN